MMKRFATLSALLAVAVASAAPLFSAPETPASSDALLSAARTKAKRDGKNVLVVFGASWCGWCRKMDAMLADPKLKPAFEKSYVIVHLDVMENGDKKALENPGAEAFLEKMGGANSGLPFYVVLNPAGAKIADSLQKPTDPGSNTGFPSADEEIAHFQTVLQKTAPKMDAKTRAAIAAYPKANG